MNARQRGSRRATGRDPGDTDSGAGRAFVLVVGRTNYVKSSVLVESLIADLEAAGHTVQRYRPTEQWLDERFEQSRTAGFCRRHPHAGGPLKKLVKLGMLMRRPSRWDYVLKFAGPPGPPGLPDSDRRRLRLRIRTAAADRVCLLAHSAGGITATLAASEPAVNALVCVGYPFKHPERADEPYRTAHLASVAKPFLIIQGDRDDYGSADDARRYALSPSTTVVGVNAWHDYGELGPDEYRRCRDLVLGFVGGLSPNGA